MQAKRLVLSQLSQGVTPCIFDNLNVLFWILFIILQILIWIFFSFTCYFVKLSNSFPRIGQLVLSDCNSFPRIRQSVLSNCNSFPQIGQIVLSDCNSFPRIRQSVLSNWVVQFEGTNCNPRERVVQFVGTNYSSVRTDCTIRYNDLLMSFFFWKSPCPFRAFVLSCPMMSYSRLL